MVILLGAAISSVVAALMALTGFGAHHRGYGPPFAVVAGLVFPITWVIWYLRDERLYAGR